MIDFDYFVLSAELAEIQHCWVETLLAGDHEAAIYFHDDMLALHERITSIEVLPWRVKSMEGFDASA